MVESIIEQMTKRLDDMNLNIVDLRRSMESRFYIMTALIVTMWVTIILAILFRP